MSYGIDCAGTNIHWELEMLSKMINDKLVLPNGPTDNHEKYDLLLSIIVTL